MQYPARYTPPLSDDFETDGDRLIELLALCWVTPETDEPIPLDEWQKWLLRHVLERYPADHPDHPGELRYRQVVISMARQQGKSVLAGGLALDALTFHKGDVISLASSREQATIIYTRVKHVIDKTPWLSKRFKKTTETRGIAKTDGSGKYKVSPAREAAMQGITMVRCILDEGHLAKTGIWTAAKKGTSAIDNAMVIMITTAGDAESKTLIDLYNTADQVIADPSVNERFGAFIWEASANSELTDPVAIMAANPAVECGRIPLERVLQDITTSPEHEVRRYTLNQFISGTRESWLAGELFRQAAGNGIDDISMSILGVDVTRNFEHATIAAAKRVGDEYQTELVASLVQPTEDKLVELIVSICQKHPISAVALDDRGMHSIHRKLKERGIPVWNLWNKEINTACMTAYAMFANGRVKHNNDPLLVVQNGRAVAKYVGEYWQVSRKDSIGDIDALLATIWALYVASAQTMSGGGVY
jgi:phage terminase large subunit-like protein